MIASSVTIVNKLGLHARAASRLVNCASGFASDIRLVKGARSVNGKSIMGLMSLLAPRGTVLTITVPVNNLIYNYLLAEGALAWADLDLPLYAGELGSTQLNFDWLIEGTIVFTEIARRVHGNWYLGARARYLDVEQALVGEFEPNLPLYESQIVASGLGLSLEYDTRDMPSNAYEGQHFTASALLNEQTLGSDNDYGVYSVDFTSYHHLSEPFVLAWTASGCTRSGDVPLWDACRLNLRGSTATDYMGRSAVMAKAEGRWHFGNRWGAVVFAGAGKITDPIFEWQDFDVIGNYGAGIRFMVSRENRINLRLECVNSSFKFFFGRFIGEVNRSPYFNLIAVSLRDGEINLYRINIHNICDDISCSDHASFRYFPQAKNSIKRRSNDSLCELGFDQFDIRNCCIKLIQSDIIFFLADCFSF